MRHISLKKELLTTALVMMSMVYLVSTAADASYRCFRCGQTLLLLSSRSVGRYGCCGNSTYLLSRGQCCGGVLIPLNDDGSGDTGCCGGQTVYNRTSEICCHDETVSPADGSKTSCCGRTAYDTRKYFCENGKVIGYHEDTCVAGRTVIVHLFNWKWTDVALECERFLGPAGFCGVQISPPNEHLVLSNPPRPWYERYQPISYKLESRSGNEDEFHDMVQRCNAVDVRIYVDAVINHMCSWSYGTGSGSAGSFFDSLNMQFPGVPFGPTDFNCCNCHRCQSQTCEIANFGDANEVRNCRLVGLLDLDLSRDYVRQKVADFFNSLIDHGVAGFRVDAMKHMWPGDVEEIYTRVKNLRTDLGFTPGTRPFFFMEVIDLGGEAIQSSEYLHLGRITEFKYGREIGKAFRRHFHLSSLRSFPGGWGFVPTQNALVFVDNHDNQRGHGGGGSTILTFYNPRPYTLATIFTLAHPYGFARIMSSHRWEGGPYKDDWIGPPHEDDGSIKSVELSANGTCTGDWVCEHRWHPITSMVKFRNVAGRHPLRNWWDNGFHQVAFSRGDRGFVVMNNEQSHPLNVRLQTGLSSGIYCDVISGGLVENNCTGTAVIVEEGGHAQIVISESEDIPAIAIHVGSRLTGDDEYEGRKQARPPVDLNLTGYHRTVVFVKYNSVPGQYVFLRGGISHERRTGCSGDANISRCAVPISYRDAGQGDHYSSYNAWRILDQKLDWYGEERGQGLFEGRSAHGSPTVWTTDGSSYAPGFQDVNRYGDHYWMLDVNMDCDAAESGWFEVKAFVLGYVGWESDVSQDVECIGQVGGTKPYASRNHVARCGFVNVFEFNDGGCTIDNFE